MRTNKRRVSVEMIKALREAKISKEMSNRSIAEAMGIPHGQVGHILRGHCTFVTDNVASLAKVLGVKLDDFKSGRRSKKKKTLWRKAVMRKAYDAPTPNDMINKYIKAQVLAEMDKMFAKWRKEVENELG